MPVPELDLHGMTKEEAIAEVDQMVDQCFCSDMLDRRVRFITGWGGVIRPAVSSYLVAHPLVKEIREEGPTTCVILEDLN